MRKRERSTDLAGAEVREAVGLKAVWHLLLSALLRHLLERLALFRCHHRTVNQPVHTHGER